VRAWLVEGQPEVCLAVADQQSAGRGRRDRHWEAPPGRALLLSAGFRPSEVTQAQSWRLAAVVSLAMLEAISAIIAETSDGPGSERLALKWPNDIVALHDGRVRKLGGVLAEGSGDDGRLVSAVVGMGVNVDWQASDFPAHLAASMWSLQELGGGRRIEREALLSGWLARLGPLYADLSRGRFVGQRWANAHISTGAEIEVDSGAAVVRGVGRGVDPQSGELIVGVPGEAAPRRFAHGDVVSCRVGPSAARL